jgi:hypothetical protein
MAQLLTSYFDQARQLGGLPATIRLATLARISSLEAKSFPDSPEQVALVKKHFETVQKEFGSKAEKIETTVEDTGKETVKKLRQYIQIFSDLMSTHAIFREGVAQTAKQITEAIAMAVNVDRASIWLYNDRQTVIECADLYEKSKNLHSSGVRLMKSDFPRYFETIKNSRTLTAEDAHTHPGTSEFSEVYLKPLGINSMLDVPIFAHGEMVGVVCQEHTGPKRKWTSDEESFAYLMGNIVGVSIERG